MPADDKPLQSQVQPGTGRIKIAAVQVAGLPEKKQRNTARTAELIRQAAAQGAQIALTPEVVLSGFVGGPAERLLAESIPGPSTRLFGDLARELGLYILLGLSESHQGHIRNALAVLGPDGRLLGAMRKVHINRYETSGGWRNGSQFPVWDFKTASGSFRGGAMICYDREMPESARLLMLQGAELIFTPLACSCPTDEVHRCLLRTRAFENEVYLCVTNHAAPRHNGHSMFIGPDGNITAEAGQDEGILLYEVDFDRLRHHRHQGLYGPNHRRPELYGSLADQAGQRHPPEANLPAALD
jgi:5-aminopentanamidase